MRGDLHGTDDRTTPNTSDAVAQAGRNDDTHDMHDTQDLHLMPVNMDFMPFFKRRRIKRMLVNFALIEDLNQPVIHIPGLPHFHVACHE